MSTWSDFGRRVYHRAIDDNFVKAIMTGPAALRQQPWNRSAADPACGPLAQLSLDGSGEMKPGRERAGDAARPRSRAPAIQQRVREIGLG